ncbi:hypothetical protein NL676_031599 [Syzygium grande]|nr:hypothetical protein NL676_031599 [Syzygium grande]
MTPACGYRRGRRYRARTRRGAGTTLQGLTPPRAGALRRRAGRRAEGGPCPPRCAAHSFFASTSRFPNM